MTKNKKKTTNIKSDITSELTISYATADLTQDFISNHEGDRNNGPRDKLHINISGILDTNKIETKIEPDEYDEKRRRLVIYYDGGWQDDSYSYKTTEIATEAQHRFWKIIKSNQVVKST